MDDKKQPQPPNQSKPAGASGKAAPEPGRVSQERKVELLNQARTARDLLIPAALSTMVGSADAPRPARPTPSSPN